MLEIIIISTTSITAFAYIIKKFIKFIEKKNKPITVSSPNSKSFSPTFSPSPVPMSKKHPLSDFDIALKQQQQ